MKQRSFTLPALLAVALAACQQSANDSNIAIDNGTADATSANAEIETLPPSDSPSAPEANMADAGNAVATPAAAVIPAAYRGRWGMVQDDCTSTRGDAKGLITIADKTIRFYEATATLKEQRPAVATSFSGQFGFTGEGQTWEKVVTLTRTGDTLKRADDEGSATYKRCA
jgi:hypothetical protein